MREGARLDMEMLVCVHIHMYVRLTPCIHHSSVKQRLSTKVFVFSDEMGDSPFFLINFCFPPPHICCLSSLWCWILAGCLPETL